MKFARKTLRSDKFLTATVFGVSGLAFASANIILARVQTVEDYAVFTLIIAVMTLSSGLGQFGADSIVNRHKVAPNSRLFFRLFCTSAIAAILSGTVVVQYYEIGLPLAGLLCVAVVSQAAIHLAAAYLRSRHAFRPSLLAFSVSNYILLAAAIAASIYGWQGALVPFTFVTCLLVLAALWLVKAIWTGYSTVISSYKYNWREALAAISITGSASALLQLERLMTPKLLTLEDLATLGVLLAIVGPPFRLLQMTLGYVLLPKLRSAGSQLEKKSLIFQEVMLALLLLAPCWILTWYLVPIVDGLFFGTKYLLSGDLVLAVIVAGTAKALSGISTASVAGLASTEQLELKGIISWVSVLVAMFAAYLCAGFGLVGLVYGVSAGWFLRIIAATLIVRRHLAPHAAIATVESQAEQSAP